LHEFYFALLVLQGEVFGTVKTEPEMLNGGLRSVEAKEPASIQSHEQLGAGWVGALGNHLFRPRRVCILFDVREAQKVARNRKLRL